MRPSRPPVRHRPAIAEYHPVRAPEVVGGAGPVPGVCPGEYEVVRARRSEVGSGAAGDYTRYKERLAATVRRREVPSSDVIMVVAFGHPLQMLPQRREDVARSCTCLVMALHESVAVTGHSGLQAGVAIRLSPLRAYSLLAVPMNMISNELVDMEVLLGQDAVCLAERLAAAPGWPQRFGILDATLTARIAGGPVPDPAVQWAWRRLKASAGGTPITFLAEQVGWSRRHLERKFLQQVGLPPKTAARIFRFEHALSLLTGASCGLADIAAKAGYSDQAHFSREVQALTQCTPAELTASLRPPMPR
jgi:AraC-like DNA-binding protein